MYIYPVALARLRRQLGARQEHRRQLAARRCEALDLVRRHADQVRAARGAQLELARHRRRLLAGHGRDLYRRAFLGGGDHQPREVEGGRQDRLRALAEGAERQARDLDLELGLPDQRRARPTRPRRRRGCSSPGPTSAETQARTSWKFAGPAKRSGLNRISLWRSPEFAAAMKNAGDNFIPAALESLEHDTDVDWRPRVPQWPAIGETMATAIQSALVGQKKPKEALDEAQARIAADHEGLMPPIGSAATAAPTLAAPGAPLRARAARAGAGRAAADHDRAARLSRLDQPAAHRPRHALALGLRRPRATT